MDRCGPLGTLMDPGAQLVADLREAVEVIAEATGEAKAHLLVMLSKLAQELEERLDPEPDPLREGLDLSLTTPCCGGVYCFPDEQRKWYCSECHQHQHPLDNPRSKSG